LTTYLSASTAPRRGTSMTGEFEQELKDLREWKRDAIPHLKSRLASLKRVAASSQIKRNDRMGMYIAIREMERLLGKKGS